MIYVGFSDDVLMKFQKTHPNVKLFNEVVHPSKDEEYANKLNKCDVDYILYDTNILDYIDLNILKFVKDDLSVVSFKEEFQYELSYMYPGEIILNLCRKYRG